jgi:integrase
VVNHGFVNGKRSRKYLYGKTRREVQEKLVRALREKQQGLPAQDERRTVEDFVQQWLRDSARPKVRPSTYERYETLLRLHVLPTLGRLPLARLGPQHLTELYRAKLSEGLSARTVTHIHRVFHSALKQALRWGFVPRNVCDAVDPPRPQPAEMATLTPEQARALLKTARGHPLEALFVLALTTGMRRGELLGLKWADLDLDERHLQVRRTVQPVAGGGFHEQPPKSAKGRRRIPLGASSVAALGAHKARQAARRLANPHAWEDLGFVFTNELGRPVDGQNMLRRSFYPLLESAGLPRIRFHDLRHTAASLLLRQGTHPKVAQEILGHSQISVTLDTYSHVSPGIQDAAVKALDALLGGAG